MCEECGILKETASMERSRSPNYPSIPLDQAVDLISKLHSKSRTNIIDRESAAKDMGYSGLTGRSLKILGALGQYDLVKASGKGSVRVTPVAVDILHGITDEDRKAALRHAGTAPKLFKSIVDRFTDGIPSENVIRSYLIQQGYADAALGPAIKSFLETNRFLENAGANDGHGPSDESESDSASVEENEDRADTPPPPPPPPSGGYRIMESERVVFSEETGEDQYLKLVAAGPLDDSLLEALEDYIRRQRKRLGVRVEA
jgi:hypothetical protein